MRLSGVGVKNVIVLLMPGAIGAIVEVIGKQLVDTHVAGRSGYAGATLVQSTSNPCATVPLLVSVRVTVASFWVFNTAFEKAVSSTVRSIVYEPPVSPSESGKHPPPS